MSTLVRTICPYCGVGCGVVARGRPDGKFDITGDPRHPANSGSLCSKGSALAETLGSDGRLLHPLLRGRAPREQRQVSWDEALTHVAQGFKAAIREHGADSIAFYVSGQLLTED